MSLSSKVYILFAQQVRPVLLADPAQQANLVKQANPTLQAQPTLQDEPDFKGYIRGSSKRIFRFHFSTKTCKNLFHSPCSVKGVKYCFQKSILQKTCKNLFHSSCSVKREKHYYYKLLFPKLKTEFHSPCGVK